MCNTVFKCLLLLLQVLSTDPVGPRLSIFSIPIYSVLNLTPDEKGLEYEINCVRKNLVSLMSQEIIDNRFGFRNIKKGSFPIDRYVTKIGLLLRVYHQNRHKITSFDINGSLQRPLLFTKNFLKSFYKLLVK